MKPELIAEGVGSMIFATVVLRSQSLKDKSPWAIAAGLLVALMLVQRWANHLNPTISIVEMIRGTIDRHDCIARIVAQILGAVAAIHVARIK